MGATWPELLIQFREDLQDTGANARWSDDLLFMYARDALRDYSMWLPRRVDREVLELDEDGLALVLPENYIDVLFVECPEDRYLEPRLRRPGVRFPAQAGAPKSYQIEGGKLYLDGDAADEIVLLTYNASHDVPENLADTEWELTVPMIDEELIRLFVKGKVYSQLRARQAALDRFKLTSGSRDDNPVQPEVEDVMAEYYAKIAMRLKGGAIILNRPGRTR